MVDGVFLVSLFLTFFLPFFLPSFLPSYLQTSAHTHAHKPTQDCYVDEDSTMLTTVARSLQKLEAAFGTIPHVKAKGPHAAMALQRFLGLKRRRLVRRAQGLPDDDNDDDDEEGENGDGGSSGAGGHQQGAPDIDTLVILDRAVDLVTPLLTPLTYEGVVDEFIGVHNGAIKVDPSLVGDE